MAFRCGKPAPDHCSEQIAADLFSGEVGGVFGFEFAFGGFQPGLEGVELFGTDATRADADGGGLPCRVAVVGAQVPLAGVSQLGEAALPLQVGAHGDALGGLGYHLAVQADLGFEVDEVAGQAGGEFIGLDGAAVGVGLGQVAGNEIGCGLVGGNVAQGQAFAHQGAGGGAVAEQFGVVAIAQAVAELMLQGPGYGGDLATLLYDGVGDGARQQAGGEGGDDLFANDVAYGGVGLLAVDVGFEAGLVAVELALDGGLVEVLHPALLFVDGGTVLCGVK